MEIRDLIKRLQKWYLTPLGRLLVKEESYHVNKSIKDFFGDYLLLEGTVPDGLLLDNKIKNLVYLSHNRSSGDYNFVSVCGDVDQLPFYNDSIDVVLLIHLLEYIDNPYMALEQIFHTLVPNGKLVILGFNPLSLWGLINLTKKNKVNSVPWSGRFIRLWHLRKWLNSFGFTIKNYKIFNFNLPIQNSFFLKWFHFLNKIGRFIFPCFGGCYIVVAEKKLLALTPVRENAVEKPVPIGAYPRPSTNLMKND